jgi:predicted ATPase
VLHRDLAFRYGHDPRISGLAYRSWSLWHLGFGDQAIQSLDIATAWARDCDHGNTTGFALVWGVMVANAMMRRAPEVVTTTRLALPILAELAQPMWYSYARVFYGWGLAHEGDYTGALSEIDAGIAGLEAIGTRRWLSLLYDLKAEALALAGQGDGADAAIADASRYLDETGDLACVADLHCVVGHLRSKFDPDAARAAYERALAIARAQDSIAMELRAATGLARLWRGQGRTKDAHQLLAPVYGRFTEGFGSPDLMEAKVLLGELDESALIDR